jgi:adenine deaminase
MKSRIEAAQGKRDSDLILKNATYLDVFSCEWRQGDIAVFDGTIVGVDSGLKSKRTIDCFGKWIVPGFVDAHVHVESSLLVPKHFQDAVLSRGTTSAVCDPHELANVQGISGIRYFLDESNTLDLDLWVMLSSCVPATHLETNGGGTIGAKGLATLLPHAKALGLAEMMNVPGVLGGDPEVLDKLARFAGRPIDGHCPLLRGNALSAYATAGITSCHESSELSEAEEKLRKGISVWIREGSVAKDLDALAPLLSLKTSTSIGFCTDDRNPLDILTEGHIDHLIRQTIRKGGVDSAVAYRSASWTVARHYGLDRIRHSSGDRSSASRIGAIAPGFQADLVLLSDERSVAIDRVLKAGSFTDELASRKSAKAGIAFENSVKAALPEIFDLEGPAGNVHVIRIIEGKIITGREVLGHQSPGVAKLSVLERYGRGSKPANGYVRGFGPALRGAIASSVGHDSHNLIVVGDRAEDMRAALASLIESGGGFSVVRDGKVLARLALPLGGLMSAEDPESLKRQLLDLKKASRSIGCELSEPFLQLAFLSLPVIPSLKLTDQGLVDVDLFKIIDVRA